jgi:hypothetical protein
MSTEVSDRIRKETSKSSLSVSRVYKSDYQKEGTETAEIRQEVTVVSFYPSKSIANDMQDNVFKLQDFGFKEEPYTNTEKRVAWIDVPVGTTAEQVVAKIAALPKAGLYRVLANKPILTDNQKYAITSPDIDVTMDTFAENQVVRYPEASANAGKLALDQLGKPQYRVVFFKADAPEDMDWRTASAGDFYSTPSIKAEMEQTAHVVEGQTL